MKQALCPACGAPTVATIDSRWNKSSNRVRRRKQCRECKHRFTTFEISMEEMRRMQTMASLGRKIGDLALASEVDLEA